MRLPGITNGRHKKRIRKITEKIADIIFSKETWETLRCVCQSLGLSIEDDSLSLGKARFLHKVTTENSDSSIISAAQKILIKYPGDRERLLTFRSPAVGYGEALGLPAPLRKSSTGGNVPYPTPTRYQRKQRQLMRKSDPSRHSTQHNSINSPNYMDETACLDPAVFTLPLQRFVMSNIREY